MRIQHNIMAMNAYRNFGNNTSALSKNLEKLSSGYKINRAGDDAAGLAISEKMRAQITGLKAAQKNVKDGISLVKTAEGAMQEIHDMLNRMDYLATQSANGTYDNEVDRANLQKEVESLKSEIDRISKSANFNGQKLLDGSLAGAAATYTAAPGDVGGLTGISIGGLTSDIKSVQINVSMNTNNGDGSATATVDEDGNLIINVVGKHGTGTEVTATDIQNAIQGIDGLKDATFTGTIGALQVATGTAATTTKVEPTASTVAGTRGPGFKIEFAKGETNLSKVTIKSETATTGGQGVTTKVDNNQKTELTITLDDAKNYTADDINKMLADAGFKEMTVKFEGSKSGADIETGLDLATAQAVTSGVGAPNQGMKLQIGDTSADYEQLEVSIDNMDSASLGIGDLNIGTPEGAHAAIDKIKAAINTVSSTRGDLGAIQNRLEHTQNNLSVMTENIQDAESTIRDTDVAEEMMAYTKNNILIQSAQAMLAQANQVPQGVLQLMQ